MLQIDSLKHRARRTLCTLTPGATGRGLKQNELLYFLDLKLSNSTLVWPLKDAHWRHLTSHLLQIITAKKNVLQLTLSPSKLWLSSPTAATSDTATHGCAPSASPIPLGRPSCHWKQLEETPALGGHQAQVFTVRVPLDSIIKVAGGPKEKLWPSSSSSTTTTTLRATLEQPVQWSGCSSGHVGAFPDETWPGTLGWQIQLKGQLLDVKNSKWCSANKGRKIGHKAALLILFFIGFTWQESGYHKEYFSF